MGYMDQVDDLISRGPGTTEIDSGTKQLMDEQKNRLGQDSTQSLLKGVGSGLLPQTPAYDYGAALGGDAGKMSAQVGAAITSRNQARSMDSVNAIKRELEMTAPARDMERLERVRNTLNSSAQMDLQNNKLIKQYELDKKRVEQYKKQASNAVLASIIGLAGTLTGGAIGAASGAAKGKG